MILVNGQFLYFIYFRGNAVFDQRVPNGFTAVAYPSLKPLTPWFKDLMQRLEFLTTWVEKGIPPVYWISGFFFPQGFTTATLQVDFESIFFFSLSL